MARCGKRVLVLEQHDRAGGSTHSFDSSENHGPAGFRFDSGLHYTVPWSGPLFQLTTCKKDVPEFGLMGETPGGAFDRVVIGEREPFDLKHKEAHMDHLRKLFPKEQAAIDEYSPL